MPRTRVLVFPFGSIDEIGAVVLNVGRDGDDAPVEEISLSPASARILATAILEAADLAETPTVKTENAIEPHYYGFKVRIDGDAED